MFSVQVAAAVIAYVLLVGAPALGQPFTFSRLVDTNTAIPDSPGNFGGSPAFVSAASSHGHYVFIGSGGIWQANPPDELTHLVRGSDGFASFSAVRQGSGLTVFTARESSTRPGIFALGQSGISTIVTTDTTVPGQGTTTFGGFNVPWTDARDVTFRGLYGTNNAFHGLYISQAGSLTRIADHTTLIPNTNTRFYDYLDWKVSNGEVTFSASNGFAVSGIYRWANGHTAALLNNSTQLPGGGGNFTGYGSLSVDGDDLAFGADTSDPQRAGIYARTQGAIHLVADFRTPLPDGPGTFDSFLYPQLFAGNVVFMTGGNTSDHVIYTDINGLLQRIIGVGDTLDGHRINTLDMSPQSRCGNNIVFRVSSGVGSARYEALYVVTIPAPGSILLVAGAGVTAVRRRRAGSPTPAR